MHGYYWSPNRLNKRLAEFVGGQFQMQRTKEGLVFQGEIESYRVENDGKKCVFLSFNWLCERRFVGFDGSGKLKPKWVKLQSHLGLPRLEVPFTTYYYQPDEERLKMWGGGWGEVCRFYKPGDWMNLVRFGADEDKFVPYYELCRTFRISVMIALLTRSK